MQAGAPNLCSVRTLLLGFLILAGRMGDGGREKWVGKKSYSGDRDVAPSPLQCLLEFLPLLSETIHYLSFTQRFFYSHNKGQEGKRESYLNPQLYPGA